MIPSYLIITRLPGICLIPIYKEVAKSNQKKKEYFSLSLSKEQCFLPFWNYSWKTNTEKQFFRRDQNCWRFPGRCTAWLKAGLLAELGHSHLQHRHWGGTVVTAWRPRPDHTHDISSGFSNLTKAICIWVIKWLFLAEDALCFKLWKQVAYTECSAFLCFLSPEDD